MKQQSKKIQLLHIESDSVRGFSERCFVGDMKKKKLSPAMTFLGVLLWICFLGCLATIIYLSVQDGEAAKAVGKDYIRKLAENYYGRDNFTPEEMVDITYRFRQYGRIVIFAILGFLGTATFHLTFHNWWWIVRAVISAGFLILVAVFTERYKIYLPTRHYSEKEMLYSIFGVMAGFIFVSLVTLFYSLCKSTE